MNSSKRTICAIIQAHNEAETIENVLRQLLRAHVNRAIVVANGCSDDTINRARTFFRRTGMGGHTIGIPTALGPDVSKAIGTYDYLRQYPRSGLLVYIDGDWKGSFGPWLEQWLDYCAASHYDVIFASHQEYPQTEATMLSQRHHSRLDMSIWKQTLGQIQSDLPSLSPAEAPMAVRTEVFGQVSPVWLYHPGLWFARCLRADIPIGTHPSRQSGLIGNPTRNMEHQRRMLETLIGDAVEGAQVVLGLPRKRLWQGRYYNGYASFRRLDILRSYIAEATLRNKNSGFGISVRNF